MTLILADDFIVCWMGDGHILSAILLKISLIGLVAAGIQIPATCLLFGTSRHRFYSISNSVEAGLIILTALILVKPYGLIGMVIGASASTFIIKMLIQPLWVAKIIKIPFASIHLKYSLPYISKVGLFILIVAIIGEYILSPTYISIFAFAVISTLIYLPYIWLLGYSSPERIRVIKALPILQGYFNKKSKM